MVLAANAADFDVISWLGGPASYIQWHRNITHSIVAIPFMALLSIAIVRLAGHRPDPLAAGLGHCHGGRDLPLASRSHQRLWRAAAPALLTGHWTRWDLTPVIDLVIWAVLLLVTRRRRWDGFIRFRDRRTAARFGQGLGRGRTLISKWIRLRAQPAAYPRRRPDGFAKLPPLQWTRAAAHRRLPAGQSVRMDGIAELSNAYVEVPIDIPQLRPS